MVVPQTEQSFVFCRARITRLERPRPARRHGTRVRFSSNGDESSAQRESTRMVVTQLVDLLNFDHIVESCVETQLKELMRMAFVEVLGFANCDDHHE
jgi:hypothetical protein